MTLRNLNHELLPLLTGRAERDVVARHANQTLDGPPFCEDGAGVHDKVADAEVVVAVAGLPEVDGEPVSRDGEGGEHGGSGARGDREDVVHEEVPGADDLEAACGDAEGVLYEVLENHDGRRRVIGDGERENW